MLVGRSVGWLVDRLVGRLAVDLSWFPKPFYMITKRLPYNTEQLLERQQANLFRQRLSVSARPLARDPGKLSKDSATDYKKARAVSSFFLVVKLLDNFLNPFFPHTQLCLPSAGLNDLFFLFTL